VKQSTTSSELTLLEFRRLLKKHIFGRKSQRRDVTDIFQSRAAPCGAEAVCFADETLFIDFTVEAEVLF